jgi:predicted MPP superfamily phosphohydrolase
VRPTAFTRRQFLGAVAGAGTLGLAADSVLWEPYHPRLTRIEIHLKGLAEEFDGFTIAQLSDFHYDPYAGAAQIRAAIELTKQLSPDLFALTGDFVTIPFHESPASRRRAAQDAEPCADLLRSLQSREGSFAVLGNHDVGADARVVTDALERRSISVLNNRAVPLERNGARFWLAGVDDVMEGKDDLNLALQGVGRNEPVVLLAHEPDFADRAARFAVGLQLSGHSHGGQIRFPFVGPLYLPPLARRYPWGLRQLGDLTLYTNVGVGTIHVPVRWNCLPEVTLVRLRAGGRSLTREDASPAGAQSLEPV